MRYPSPGVQKTASGTGHIFFVQLPPSNVAKAAGPRWREVAAVTEAVVTVLCTPDDGCG